MVMRAAFVAVWICACAQAGMPSPITGDDDAGSGSGSGMPDGGMHTCTMSCDDSNVCTTDSCDNGTCAHVDLSCDDADACTTDSCDMVTGCAHVNNNHGAQTFTANGTIQTFAVPTCVTSLHVVASGAQGGGVTASYPGGYGATLEGDFPVAVGQNISILVGGAGLDGNANTDTASEGQRGGTGGGGTFVVRDVTILLIAGGGGGACGPFPAAASAGIPGGPGVITTNGAAGSGGAGGAAGGTNGAGGAVYS